jgi:ABC-2 type transport system ATP-binding protein
VISVRNLTKRFGDVLAVHDVTFDVADGEVMGFLGPNGAGKSTTIRILTGYIPATSGTVQIAGRLPHSAPRSGSTSATCPRTSRSTRDARRGVPALPRAAEGGRGARRPRPASSARWGSAACHMRRRIVGPALEGRYRRRVGLADALVARRASSSSTSRPAASTRTRGRRVLGADQGARAPNTVLLSSHVLAEIEASRRA